MMPSLNSETKNMSIDAFGGVVLDNQGRVLLREPTNHFGGYVWTWPKGRPNPTDTPEQAAIREVYEETGYPVDIIMQIPGIFQAKSGSSRNIFYLMRVSGNQHKYDWETSAVRWATFEEARKLIALTTFEEGRLRDLAVLKAVEGLVQRLTIQSKKVVN